MISQKLNSFFHIQLFLRYSNIHQNILFFLSSFISFCFSKTDFIINSSVTVSSTNDNIGFIICDNLGSNHSIRSDLTIILSKLSYLNFISLSLSSSVFSLNHASSHVGISSLILFSIILVKQRLSVALSLNSYLHQIIFGQKT